MNKLNYYNKITVDYSCLNITPKDWKGLIRHLKKFPLKICSPTPCIIEVLYKNEYITVNQIREIINQEVLEYCIEKRIFVADINCLQYKEKLKQLPFNEKMSSKTYLFYAFRLGIIESQNTMKSRLMDQFINLKYIDSKKAENFIFFCENTEKYFYTKRVTYDELFLNEIISFTINNIEKGKYVDIHLDDFYILNKENYNKINFVHQNLIYGYNLGKRVFYAYGISRNSKFKEFEISFDEYIISFISGRLNYFCGAKYLDSDYPWPITIYSLKDLSEVKIDLSDILREINNYLYCSKIYNKGEELHIEGIEIFNYVTNALNNKTLPYSIDYRMFQLFYEHKKIIEERIKYLSDMLNQKSIAKLAKEYKSVVNQFNEIRFIFFKLYYTYGSIDMLSKHNPDKSVRENLRVRIKRARDEEVIILQKLREIITK